MNRGARGRLRLADDLHERPWWREDAGRPAPPEPDLPATVDVVIVGAGYTGLSAALTLAQSGARVAVFDSGDPGDGASGRNGGMVGDRLNVSWRTLARRYGAGRATALQQEARSAVDYVERLTVDLGIDCGFARVGRFCAAASPAHLRAMRRELEAEPEDLREGRIIPPGETAAYVDSPLYHGGELIETVGCIHPVRYHTGLLEAVRKAGVPVLARTQVLASEEDDDGLTVETGIGFVRADRMLVCTNGYTDMLEPNLQRRVVPVTSAMIATGELDPDLVARLVPGGRMITDSFHLLHYFRPSPDGRRILLGHRPAPFHPQRGRRLAAFLARRLGEILPALDGATVTHCWQGRLGFSFDFLPKIGLVERTGFAMCYGGSGVAMASWLGHKLGQKAAGDLAGRTAFDDIDFPARFYHRGTPWFVPPAMAVLALDDWRHRRRRRLT
ncbi:MAG: FAD-binding oxidoreductase [Pseudomonadota bacterium]|nr:FAD-binding oxidoreductase [Pseudomonadota bacterium]